MDTRFNWMLIGSGKEEFTPEEAPDETDIYPWLKQAEDEAKEVAKTWDLVESRMQGAKKDVDKTKTIFGNIETAFDGMGKTVNDMSGTLKDWFDKAVARLKALARKASSGGSTGYALGGMIVEPIVGYGQRTGEQYTFGEDGSELIVPNNRMSEYMRGGNNIAFSPSVTITVNAQGQENIEGIEQRIAEKVKEEMMDALHDLQRNMGVI